MGAAAVGAIMTARGFFPGMRSMVGAGVMAAPVEADMQAWKKGAGFVKML
jgi:hypothetical protein